MGAGYDLQSAAAHPGLEGQLQVLAAPDVKARVVGAQSIEELPVDGEESTGHGGRVDGLGRALENKRRKRRSGVKSNFILLIDTRQR